MFGGGECISISTQAHGLFCSPFKEFDCIRRFACQFIMLGNQAEIFMDPLTALLDQPIGCHAMIKFSFGFEDPFIRDLPQNSMLKDEFMGCRKRGWLM